jgi:hypothetical protein
MSPPPCLRGISRRYPRSHAEYCTSPDCKAHHSIHQTLGYEDERPSCERKEIMEWNGVVESYAECNLTFRSNKLMALSEIAAHFAPMKLPEDKYFAGIWSSQLPSALLSNPKEDLPRSKKNIGPRHNRGHRQTVPS